MDRTAKLLLVALTLGLWANFGALVLRPHAAIAQGACDLSNINDYLDRLTDIADGTCKNKKLC